MNIIVHGTKGGYRVLYPVHSSIAFDSRSQSAIEDPVGQSCYSISFTGGGCVISKLTIIRDVLRSKATGNIAFSVLIPFNERIAGAEIRALLDELSDYYLSKYISDYNLGDKSEDWSFIEDHLKVYFPKISQNDDIENFAKGDIDAAFVYISNDAELQRYLDKPYQIEYVRFKQVFLVNSKLINRAENPLNALKHSNTNLTGKIDFENTKYKVQIKTVGTDVRVYAHGREYTNGDKIREKDILTFEYYRKNHESIKIEGTANRVYQEYPNAITLDKEKGVLIISSITLDPLSKDFAFNIIDSTELPIPNVAIECINKYSRVHKTAVNNSLSFLGDELEQSWDMRFLAEGYEEAYRNNFIPNKCNDCSIIIKVKKIKVITVNIIDQSSNIGKPLIYNLDVYRQDKQDICKLKSDRFSGNSIVFYDKDIEYDWFIKISCDGYNVVNTEPFSPLCQNIPITIPLQKKERAVNYPPSKMLKYYVDLGQNGDWEGDVAWDSIKKDGTDIIKFIIPKKGYEFSHFIFENRTYDGYAGTLNAQYQTHSIFSRFLNKSNAKWLTLTLGITSLIICCFWIFLPQKGSLPTQNIITSEQIYEYISGDALLPDTLEFYAEVWKSYKPKDDNMWFNPATWFGGTQAKSEEYNNWESVLNKITNAQQLRIQVDNLDLTKLNTEPSLPRVLIDVIRSIDDQNRTAIIEKLGNTKSLSIRQIADKIDEINKGLTPDIGTEIRNYLQNADLTLEKIEKYHSMEGLSNIDDKLNPSLLLAKRFWQLPKVVVFVNKQQTTQTWNIQQYKTKVDSDPYLRDNKLFKDLIEKLAGIANLRLPSSLPQADKDKPLSEIGAILISSSTSGAVPISNAGAGNVGQSQNSQQALAQTAISDSDKDLIEYLESDKIKKSELEDYSKTTRGKLKNSIDLAIKFWSLDGTTNNSYSSYKTQLTNDGNFTNSALFALVKDFCDETLYPRPKYATALRDLDKNKRLSDIAASLKK